MTTHITEREMQVWRMAAEGRVTKEIAADLGLSTKTVENHRANLYQKIGSRSLADVARLAVQYGLIKVTVTPLVQSAQTLLGKTHQQFHLPNIAKQK